MRDAAYDDFIDKLRSSCDIVEVIAEYVPLKKKGNNFWGCCPFHSEKTASFSVNPAKGFFYCFGCQAGGNVFTFLMKVENISFWDAAKQLANKLNIPLPEKEKSAQELAREREITSLYKVNQMASEFFHSCLMNTNYGVKPLQYLHERGVAREAMIEYQIGFAPPGWDKLFTSFRSRGVEPELLLNAGLIMQRASGNGFYDRFRERIMFPICDVRGRVIGFGGRVMDGDQPKYLNSPETKVFNKRRVLYGFDKAERHIRSSGQAIVVEGYMDLITAQVSGVHNAVASLGTAFSVEQSRLLLRCASEIVFAYDSDAAGQNATARALAMVRDQGASVRVISVPDGKDPDEFIRRQGAEAFQLLIDKAPAFLEYMLRQSLRDTDYSTLEGKVSVVGKLLPALAVSDNAVEVNAYIVKIAQILALDEQSIRSELRKFQTSQQTNLVTKQKKEVFAGSRKMNEATHQAEQLLIRLMCENQQFIEVIQERLNISSIQDQNHLEIIHSIYITYEQKNDFDPAAITSELTEPAAAEFSQIMMSESNFDDIQRILSDCLRTIQVAYLNHLYEQHRLRADELERLGDSSFLQELAESQRIKNEINKIHKLQ
ncbi:MAG: primase [Firmicutes bacterium]|nr:primase [Bacillota bacterium]